MARFRKKARKTKKRPSKVLGEQKALVEKSVRAGPSRRKNILANTPNVRIKGHASGAHRRAQGRRDAKRGSR